MWSRVAISSAMRMGVAQGKQQDAEADADALRAAGDGRGHHDGGGEHAEGDEVVLGQPHGLDAHVLGFCGDAEAVLEGLLIGNVVKGGKTRGTVRSAWGVLRPDAEWATLAREMASREVNWDYNRFHGKEGTVKC